MADTSIKFGVVHGAPSQLSSATIEEGKLYFLAGEADGAIKQGIYGVDGITADASGNVTDYNLAMFGTGAVADGIGYGLSQYNFDSDASTKLKNLHDASSNYLLKSSYVQVSKSSDGYVPKADNVAGTIDSQDVDWVLTYNGTSVDWHKLPANAFKNDNSIYTGTSPINVNGTTISHANSSVAAGRYGDTGSARTLEFGGKFKVVDVSVNAFGHVTNAASYELTLPSKPATAGTADEAKKTTGTLTIKGNGTSVGTFNGSVAEEVNIKSGSVSTLTITGAADGSITITPQTAAVASNSNALTTGAQVASYVSTELGKLSGALIYKDTITSYDDLPTASTSNTGHVYICSSTFTTTAAQTGVEYRIEVGDMFISNGEKWNIVSSEFDVSTYSNALAWGTDVSIAVVDGVTIKATLPANPNTDEKVKANTSTSKFYLIGQDDVTNGTTETTYKNASVYAEGGYLYSGDAKVLTSYTEQYQGTVTSITPGTGLTGTSSNTAITTTGTLNLKIASSSEIGGVKPGTTSGKTYGVQVNASTGEMTVNVPWTDNNDNTWRGVYVGGTQRLGTEVTSGSLNFVNGTNITATWNSTNKTIQFDASGLATDAEVATAKSEAIEAATIYWETL